MSDDPGLLREIEYALTSGYADFSTAAVPSGGAAPFTVDDVAGITDWDVETHGSAWKLGDDIGSELDMVVVGVLHDGRWFSISAGNDYTGWGCVGDYCDVKVATSWAALIRDGLTNEERHRLAIRLDQEATS